MTKELDLYLQVDVTAPRDARRQVDTLATGLPEDLRQDLQLLVSELVANSLRHASLSEEDWIGLRASIDERTIRVEVSDPGDGFRRLGGDARPRSGLWILNELADRWGIVRDDVTRVWFETDLEDTAEPRGRAVGELATWPPLDRRAAQDLVRLYGPPDAVEAGGLVWRRDGVEITIRSPGAPASGLAEPTAG